MTDYAIIYACVLALFGALLMWMLPTACIALTESVAACWSARKNGDRPSEPKRFRPLRPRFPRITLPRSSTGSASSSR